MLVKMGKAGEWGGHGKGPQACWTWESPALSLPQCMWGWMESGQFSTHFPCLHCLSGHSAPQVHPHLPPSCRGCDCASLFPGWSGSGGLGAKEQGIQDPIKGGDVRDKWDQYKGVGVALDDPYENYRRNKSYSFIARMKARDECK